jgi:hypothetical protein
MTTEQMDWLDDQHFLNSRYIWNEERQRMENPDNPRDYILAKEQVQEMGRLGLITLQEQATLTNAKEVRTVSESGGEKGVKAEAYALLPSEALDEIARVYAFGAEKYAAHNWRKGYEWNKSFSAMMRHLWAFWRGEDLDPESGLSHLGHAGFHVLGLLTFWLKRDLYGKFDDRYKDD